MKDPTYENKSIKECKECKKVLKTEITSGKKRFFHRITKYFTKGELILWFVSLVTIIMSFVLFDGSSYLTLAASIIGATSLIFSAKGNPIGMLLMIVFSILYGIISFTFAYYGEMITYLGMTGPMALIALIAWLCNPYKGNKAQVRVNSIKKGEVLFMLLLTAVVTAGFYFLLKVLGTANLVPSTVSVATSFAAAYLTFRRSPFFALVYAANDVILILLWILASIEDKSYVSVTVCFVMFLFNDLYGFISWRRMEKKQREHSA